MDKVRIYHMTRVGPSGYKYIYYMSICNTCMQLHPKPDHEDWLGEHRGDHDGECQHSGHNRSEGIIRLVECGAPLPMFHHLTGMGSRNYSELRKIYYTGKVLEPGYEVPTDEQLNTVWAAVNDLQLRKDNWSTDDYFALYEHLGGDMSLRVIWLCVRRWDLNGQLEEAQ